VPQFSTSKRPYSFLIANTYWYDKADLFFRLFGDENVLNSIIVEIANHIG